MFEGNLGARRSPPSRSSKSRLKTVSVSPISDAAGRPAGAPVAAVPASIRERTALTSAADARPTRARSSS